MAADETPIRRLLLALILLGSLGLIVELALLEHFESVLQWLPVPALGFGAAASVAALVRPTRTTLRLVQASMVLFIALGLLGLWLHYRGNLLFEQEIDGEAAGPLLLWRAARGATPALAPGALVQLGLLGLICAYRHPAITARRPEPEPDRPRSST